MSDSCNQIVLERDPEAELEELKYQHKLLKQRTSLLLEYALDAVQESIKQLQERERLIQTQLDKIKGPPLMNQYKFKQTPANPLDVTRVTHESPDGTRAILIEYGQTKRLLMRFNLFDRLCSIFKVRPKRYECVLLRGEPWIDTKANEEIRFYSTIDGTLMNHSYSVSNPKDVELMLKAIDKRQLL